VTDKWSDSRSQAAEERQFQNLVAASGLLAARWALLENLAVPAPTLAASATNTWF